MNTLLLNGTAYGTIPALVDPSDGITAVTPSALTALVIKNGTDTADSVTITAVGGGRTGVYKWSYNPAGEVEGDQFSIVFTITISSLDYYHNVDLVVEAAERGTDNASTHAAADVLTEIQAVTLEVSLNAAQRVQLAATQPDYAPAKAGDEMALPNSTLTALFSDADVADLVNQIVAQFDGASDLPIATIASATRDAILDRLLSGNHDTVGTVGNVLQFLDVLLSSRSTFNASADEVITDEASRTASKNTKSELREAINGRWTDETNEHFDLTVLDTP